VGLITEALLELLSAAEGGGEEIQFRWVRREDVQDADVDRMHAGLCLDWLK
jgi:hypothetical protein